MINTAKEQMEKAQQALIAAQVALINARELVSDFDARAQFLEMRFELCEIWNEIQNIQSV
jgi:hypothetical protein